MQTGSSANGIQGERQVGVTNIGSHLLGQILVVYEDEIGTQCGNGGNG